MVAGRRIQETTWKYITAVSTAKLCDFDLLDVRLLNSPANSRPIVLLCARRLPHHDVVLKLRMRRVIVAAGDVCPRLPSFMLYACCRPLQFSLIRSFRCVMQVIKSVMSYVGQISKTASGFDAKIDEIKARISARKLTAPYFKELHELGYKASNPARRRISTTPFASKRRALSELSLRFNSPHSTTSSVFRTQCRRSTSATPFPRSASPWPTALRRRAKTSATR